MLCYVNNEIISNFSKKVGRIAGYCLRLENSNKRFDNRDGRGPVQTIVILRYPILKYPRRGG